MCWFAVARRTKAAIAAVATWQGLDLDESRARHGHHDKLCDSIAHRDGVRLRDVRIEQSYSNLAAVARIDRARAVDNRDAVLHREPASRHDERYVPVGKGDGYASANCCALAWAEHHSLVGYKISASVARMRVLRNDPRGDEYFDGFSHPTRLVQNGRAAGIASDAKSVQMEA